MKTTPSKDMKKKEVWTKQCNCREFKRMLSCEHTADCCDFRTQEECPRHKKEIPFMKNLV